MENNEKFVVNGNQENQDGGNNESQKTYTQEEVDALKSQMSKEYQEQVTREHYHSLTKFLIEKKMTITTMESATSGQIASLITDTEGASAILP